MANQQQEVLTGAAEMRDIFAEVFFDEPRKPMSMHPDAVRGNKTGVRLAKKVISEACQAGEAWELFNKMFHKFVSGDPSTSSDGEGLERFNKAFAPLDDDNGELKNSKLEITRTIESFVVGVSSIEEKRKRIKLMKEQIKKDEEEVEKMAKKIQKIRDLLGA